MELKVLYEIRDYVDHAIEIILNGIESDGTTFDTSKRFQM